MICQMDEVLWEFSKFYGKMFCAENPENPDAELSTDAITIAILRAMERSGDAVQNIRPDGNVTWKATPQFLESTDRETGPLVTLESTLN